MCPKARFHRKKPSEASFHSKFRTRSLGSEKLPCHNTRWPKKTKNKPFFGQRHIWKLGICRIPMASARFPYLNRTSLGLPCLLASIFYIFQKMLVEEVHEKSRDLIKIYLQASPLLGAGLAHGIRLIPHTRKQVC